MSWGDDGDGARTVPGGARRLLFGRSHQETQMEEPLASALRDVGAVHNVVEFRFNV